MPNERPANLSRLVIRVSTGSLSFSTTRHEQVLFEDYSLNSGISLAANLREALRTMPLLATDYQRVLVMVDTPVLMVPSDLFNMDTMETEYRHAFTQFNAATVKHTVLPDLNGVAVFAVNKDLLTVVNDHFDSINFTPVAAPVWRHMHRRSYTGPREKLYGYFHDRKLEVFCFTENRFKFCNSFTVNNPNDALYYLLSSWKQLGLGAEHDELHLVGQLPDSEGLVEEARRFVKRVFLINPSGEFNRAAITQIEGMPYDLMVLYIKGR